MGQKVVVKYTVQLTNSATSEVQVLEVEASSEEEAIGMFDASKFDVAIIRPDDELQASRERIARLREEARTIDKAIQNHYVVKLVFLVIFGAAIIGCGLVSFLNNHFDRGKTDLFRPEKSEVQKALEIEVLSDR